MKKTFKQAMKEEIPNITQIVLISTIASNFAEHAIMKALIACASFLLTIIYLDNKFTLMEKNGEYSVRKADYLKMICIIIGAFIVSYFLTYSIA